MTPAPVFQDDLGRDWSIGSNVIAHWWERGPRGPVERAEGGVVVGLTRSPAGSWVVEVDFGPVWAPLTPPQFNVGQILLDTA